MASKYTKADRYPVLMIIKLAITSKIQGKGGKDHDKLSGNFRFTMATTGFYANNYSSGYAVCISVGKNR